MARPSAGRGTKDQIEEFVKSRKFAEAVSRTVGNDYEIKQLRYGNFAEEGAIGQEFLPNGMSPNLLPARWAEYEGYPDDLDVGYVTGGEGDSWIENTLGFNMLVLDPAGASPATLHNTYLDKLDAIWVQLVEGQTYIYSYSAIVPPWSGEDGTYDPGRYLGLRIYAANDSAGTSPVSVYNTTNQPAGNTHLVGNGQQARIYGKFTVPVGKPWVRIQIKILYEIIEYPYTGINWNMLEIVNDSRSFPSKYAAPTPRAGELTPTQMAFGEGANLMPYSKGSLAKYEGVDVSYGSQGIQGDVTSSLDGLGYYFLTYNDNQWHAPSDNLGPVSGDTAARLVPGKQYIVSAFVTNKTPAARIATQLRATTADAVGDFGTKSGSYQVKATGTEVYLDIGETKRVFVKYTHDSLVADSTTGAIGPGIEIKNRRLSGSGSFKQVKVSGYMVEEVDTDDKYPSSYAVPSIGRNELSFNQIELTPAAHKRQGTNQSIANGATSQINLDTLVFSYNWGGTISTAVDYIQVFRKGLYLLSANVSWDLSGTNGNNRLILYIRAQIGGVNTEYQLASQITPAISGDGGMSGSIQLPSQGSEASGGTGHRIFVRCANTSESAARTVTACRLMMTYMGDNTI